jgi:hypothetical protein
MRGDLEAAAGSPAVLLQSAGYVDATLVPADLFDGLNPTLRSNLARGAVLAPLYDALCTAAYPELSDRMAMKIGSKYRYADLYPRHWAQFATEAGLSPAQVKKALKRTAERLPELAQQTQAQLAGQGHKHAVIGQISRLIDDRCATTLRRLAMPGADEPAEDAPGTAPDSDTPDH